MMTSQILSQLSYAHIATSALVFCHDSRASLAAIPFRFLCTCNYLAVLREQAGLVVGRVASCFASMHRHMTRTCALGRAGA